MLLAIDFRALVGDKRKRAISVHLLYQALGLLLLLLGFAAMWVNKSLQGHPHLATTHGVLGFTALLALTAAAVGGAFSFRALGILDKLPGLLQPYVKSAHRCDASASCHRMAAFRDEWSHSAAFNLCPQAPGRCRVVSGAVRGVAGAQLSEAQPGLAHVRVEGVPAGAAGHGSRAGARPHAPELGEGPARWGQPGVVPAAGGEPEG